MTTPNTTGHQRELFGDDILEMGRRAEGRAPELIARA
jgi:hypothetical protein